MTWIKNYQMIEEEDSMQGRNEFEELIEHIRYQVEEERINHYIHRALGNMDKNSDLKKIIKTIADESHGEDFVIRINIEING